MRPFYLAVTTLVPGLFTSMALLVLADVASPTFNVEEIPAWTGSQAAFVFVPVLTVSFALGIVMHTLSRGLLHKQKQQWSLEVLASGAVENRMAVLGTVYPSPGGPTYAELWDEEEGTHNRAWRAAMFMHGVEYQLMVRAPHVFEAIQVYREQYRTARDSFSRWQSWPSSSPSGLPSSLSTAPGRSDPSRSSALRCFW